MRSFLSKICIVLGIIFLLCTAYFSWQRLNPWRLSFSSIPTENRSISAIKNFPHKLVIKRLNINLPIVPAKINKKEWEVTDAGVSYLITSAVPGDRGNSILYGHNWSNLLGNITQAKTGDKIEIYNAQKKYTFVVDSTAIVSPNQFDVLKNTSDYRITLYTCTGFLDSQRFVVIGKLQ